MVGHTTAAPHPEAIRHAAPHPRYDLRTVALVAVAAGESLYTLSSILDV
jgi:hypothetical protein